MTSGPAAVLFAGVGAIVRGMWSIDPNNWSQSTTRPDAALARLAALQHGVVTRDQLLIAGVNARGITYRLKVGRLHELHRGVYAVGHRPPSPPARAMAAVLACGPGAALSHRSAAGTVGDHSALARSRGRHRIRKAPPVAGKEVDMLYRDQRLIVELDSRTFHLHTFEEDRERDAHLLSEGFTTVRVTKRRLTDRPEREASRLRRLLSGGSLR